MASSSKWSALVLALLLTGCEDDPAPRLFKVGDVVEFVVNGQRAQIIHVNHCEGWKVRKYGKVAACTYEVRMAAPQIFTDTHLIVQDGPLKTRSFVRLDYVKEYELRKVDP